MACVVLCTIWYVYVLVVQAQQVGVFSGVRFEVPLLTTFDLGTRFKIIVISSYVPGNTYLRDMYLRTTDMI